MDWIPVLMHSSRSFMVIQSQRTSVKHPIAVATFLGFVIWMISSCSRPVTPESRFKIVFEDMSVGAPPYQVLVGFSQPQSVIKGDFFTADFTTSRPQFDTFMYRSGGTNQDFLSPKGAWITAQSRMNPRYPWILEIHTQYLSSDTNLYQVHIEGKQPYD